MTDFLETACKVSRRALLVSGLLVAAACAMPSSEPAMVLKTGESEPFTESSEDATRMVARTLTRELDDPWGLAFLPDGDLLVTEREGVLKRLDGKNFKATVIDGLPEIAASGQGGLMDVIVHPEFAEKRWIYLSYSIAGEGGLTTRVSRAKLIGDRLEELQILFTAQPAYRERRHFGSRLLLDEGYLYLTVGDRGNRDLAQSLETHNGKVMRLTEDGAVPSDNPFVDRADARPEIWTYGHRNPQGIARHPVSGAVWISEHGPQGGDEVNELIPGANYGWPLATYGEEYGGGKIGQGTHMEGTEQPLVYWVPSIGAAGMAFYDDETYQGWQPSLLVAGLRLTRISRLELDGNGLGRETRLLSEMNMRIRDVRVGPDGRVYLLANGSRLLRLDPET